MEENYNFNQNPKRRSGFFLFAFVIVMVFANVWIINKAFSEKENPGDLPKFEINMISASSLIMKKSDTENASKYFDEKINILVLGKSGGNYIAPNLTDTILIAHIDGSSKKIKLISIPRDLAVKIPGSSEITKINALYQIGLRESETKGLELVRKKVEEVTGLKIDSFVIFDLETVEKIIDEIGGVNVFVKDDINDTKFPTPSGGYEIFSIQKGTRYLDGKTALKFIRTRNTPGGDFDRIARQQEVLKALKGKIISLNPIWDFGKIWTIFKTVQKNVRTDLGTYDLKNIWSLAKSIDLDKIETLSLNSESGLLTDQKIKIGGNIAYVLVAKPKQFEYTGIKLEIYNFLEK